ncbi:MAG: adenine phosphoribosyltransferase [Candidatus Omnitrophica bacterium]|nr:adenine phosphoribosyltransferase [Candidatus Omnitrophota bacterium]
MNQTERLAKSIRDIPDFPKPGIIFKDITTLLQNPKTFKIALDALYARYKNQKIDKVVCVEARGFIFGSVLAYKLGAGLVLVRKKGKLPYNTYGITYALEYGKDTLQIHQDAVCVNEKILVVDDLLATGGTIAAVCRLLKKMKAKIVGVAFLIELTFLPGRKKLKNHPVFSLIKF